MVAYLDIFYNTDYPLYNYSKDRLPFAVAVDSGSITTGLYENFSLITRITAVPTEGFRWKFSWPGGEVVMTWSEVPLFSTFDTIKIGANELGCMLNAAQAFFKNAEFIKHFDVIQLPDLPGIEIRAKKAGPQFYGTELYSDDSGEPSVTEYISPLDDSMIENHQIGLLLLRNTDTSIGTLNIREVVTEHIAPLTRQQDSEAIISTQFELQEPMHAITSFCPPDLNQPGTIVEAVGHVAEVLPAWYGIMGSPPKKLSATYGTIITAVRGGGRLENSKNPEPPGNSSYNYFRDYVVGTIRGTQRGILSFSELRNVTLKQEQYRYWYCKENVLEPRVMIAKISVTFKRNPDGSVTNFTMALNSTIFEAYFGHVYIIPVGFKQLHDNNIPFADAIVDVYNKTVDDIDYYQITLYDYNDDILRASFGEFRIVDSVFGERYFLAETSAGGAEVFRCTGRRAQHIEIAKEEYNQIGLREDYWNARKIAQQLVNYTDLYECATGNLTREEVIFYAELLISENVWEIIYQDDLGVNRNGYRYPIRIEPGTFQICKDNRDGEYLYSLTFKYRRAYSEKSIGILNNF